MTACLATLAVWLSAPPADAAIAKVQTGSVVTSSSASLSATLPASSTAGDLLVATITENGTTTFSAPAGWIAGPAVSTTGTYHGRAEIWYYPNNPGGISSATFTASGATQVGGQLSEWSGVATTSPLDTRGTNTATSASSITASTTSAPTATGDVGITAFDLAMSRAQNITFTPSSGWANLGNNGTGGTANTYTGDYQLGLGASTISETESASRTWDWAAAIATFKPASAGACTGGALNLTTPTTASFPSIALNGKDQAASSSVTLTPNDQTGSGAGWNITGASTTFTNASSKALATTATTLTGATATAASGQCSAPTNTITYPITLPAGATPPAAVKLYDARPNTGAGPTNVSFNTQLAVSAKAYSGTYNSTWTFTIASGP